MPHIIIEYSANLAELTDIDALVAAVHQAALDDGLPALDALRTRAAPREHYRIADGDPAYGFVAVTARVGPGRPNSAIEAFLDCLVEAVDQALAPLRGRHPVAISAEVQFIDPDFRRNLNHVRAYRAGEPEPIGPAVEELVAQMDRAQMRDE